MTDDEEREDDTGPCTHVFQGVDDHDECIHCGARCYYSFGRQLAPGIGPMDVDTDGAEDDGVFGEVDDQYGSDFEDCP